MKADEAIIRLVGGAGIGVALGVIFSAAPPPVVAVLARVLGMALVLGFGLALTGASRAVRWLGFGLGLIALVLALWRATLLRQLLATVVALAGILGNVLLTVTTQSAGSAILIWAILVASFNLSLGIIGSWRTTARRAASFHPVRHTEFHA